MFEKNNTLRMKRLVVAIISVMLILVTTIGYSADVYAAGAKTAAAGKQNGRTEGLMIAGKDTVSGGDLRLAEKEKTEKSEEAADKKSEDAEKKDSADKKSEDAEKKEAAETEKDADSGKQKSGENAGGAAEPDKDGQSGDADSEGSDAESGESEDGLAPEDAAGLQLVGQDQNAAAAEETANKTKKPDVSSTSYVVMSGSTSEVVMDHHGERKMQPGKITMLVTAMVAIDNMYNEEELKNTVETGDLIASYGTTFKEGESISVGDLLKAMLVGGDIQAAELLAKYSASSREIFVNEMNSKCMELGIMDTMFTNASGRYDTMQYSTAKDLAVIAQAAFRYRMIRDALKTPKVTVTARTKYDEREIMLSATDPLLAGKGMYEYINGGIAGTPGHPVYTTQFAAAATKDDMQLIVILMDSRAELIADEARDLFEYADTKVTRNTIVKAGKMEGHARVRGGTRTWVPAYTETKGFAYVPPEGSDSLIETRVMMFDDLEAPLQAGSKVGEFRIFVADELKGTVDLVIKDDVPEGWPPSKIYISNRATIGVAVFLVLVLLFVLRVMYVKKRREKRREAMRRQKIRELARMQLEIDEDRRRRNWNGQGYAPMPPRTMDIRKESLTGEGAEEEGGKI